MFSKVMNPRWLVLGAVVSTFTFAVTAGSALAAGANFIATGHDMDLHCAFGSTDECAYFKIVVDKVRNGSSLPILALDQGTEIPDALAAAGYSPADVVTIDPSNTAVFNATPFTDGAGHPLYSAIITASDSTCGGCDNTPAGESNINARASDFTTFFDAGGGILALAGADNFATYYNFVPLSGVTGVAVTEPFTVTSDGAALGITNAMANCCATHNSFAPPASPFVILENDSATPTPNAETIAAFNASISGGGFTSGDQAITATGTTVNATEGKSFTGTVATFKDADTSATASEYSASINWGDGSTSAGTVTGSGGNFTVTGTHIYKEQGSYTVKATITDVDNTANTATATSTAHVADAALHATGAQPSKSGLTVNGTLATFTDDNPGAKTTDYTVTITWGDGSTSKGTVTQGTGHFNVSGGSHTYGKAGTYTITVKIVDDGGSTATVTDTVTVFIRGSARLSGVPFACVHSPHTLQVKGKRIASVTWTVNGKKVSGRTVHKGTLYSAKIGSSPGAHHAAAHVKFVAGSHTGARTLRATVTGCNLPTFTG